MTHAELYEHQRHLESSIRGLEAKIPSMDPQTKERAIKTIDNLCRELERAIKATIRGAIQ